MGDEASLASTFLCDGEAAKSTAGLMMGPISGLMAGVTMAGAEELPLETVTVGEDIMAVAGTTAEVEVTGSVTQEGRGWMDDDKDDCTAVVMVTGAVVVTGGWGDFSVRMENLLLDISTCLSHDNVDGLGAKDWEVVEV